MAGTITIARHGEPALSRKVKLTPAQYGDFWARYEIGGLLPGQTTPAHLEEESKAATVVYVSTRRRAQESARILIGQRHMIEDARLIEAPLPPPPFPSWLKLSPKIWGFFARFWWWWFNHHAGGETRDQARARVRQMAKVLSDHADAGEQVLVVAHGFLNFMLGLELTQLGWSKVWGRGYKYWSTRRFERR